MVCALGFLAMPLAASADQITDLQAQAQVLSQLLAKLKAGGSVPAPAASGTCTAPSSAVGPGTTSAAVTALQKFLARDRAIYPEGKVTGYYGPLTTAAVQRLQVKYNIVSSGTPATTGYGRVGPKTLELIKSLCGEGSTDDNVGAFMQVSPVEGAAPLQVNIQVTVNTTNSCAAAVYKLDFGDQSQGATLSVPPGTCQTLQQTYTHTYQQVAQYELTLSSGTHSSQATVVAQ